MEAKKSNEVPFEKGEVTKEEYATSKDSDTLSINDAARGDNLPDNYFLSVSFIGTLVVSASKTFRNGRKITGIGTLPCANLGVHLLDPPHECLDLHQ